MSYTHFLACAVGCVFMLGAVLCLACVWTGDDGSDHDDEGKGCGND